MWPDAYSPQSAPSSLAPSHRRLGFSYLRVYCPCGRHRLGRLRRLHEPHNHSTPASRIGYPARREFRVGAASAFLALTPAFRGALTLTSVRDTWATVPAQGQRKKGSARDLVSHDLFFGLILPVGLDSSCSRFSLVTSSDGLVRTYYSLKCDLLTSDHS